MSKLLALNTSRKNRSIPPQKEKEGDKEGEKEEEATKKPKDVEAEEKCGKTTDEKVKM